MTEAVVERVDRLTVLASPPEPLFRALTERLLLPAAWPVTLHPRFTSGGVNLGNLHLEVLQVRRARPPGDASRRARLHSLAFQLAPFDESLPELDRRGVPHTPPEPYYIVDDQGWQVNAWTSIVLNRLLGSSPLAGIYQALARRAPVEPWQSGALAPPPDRSIEQTFIYERVYPTGMITALNYNPAWRALNIRSDPPAGGIELLGVYEITVGLRDFSRAYPLWAALLAPHPELVEGVWELPGGLHLRLIDLSKDAPQHTASRRPGITRMIWQVASLNRAAQFLHRRGILGPETGGQITISPAAIAGLDVRLVQ